MTVPPPSALGQRPRGWGWNPLAAIVAGEMRSARCVGGGGVRLPGGESQRAETAQNAPRGRNPESRQGPRCAGRVREHRLPGWGTGGS